jgi:hypothetical protein
LPGNLSAADAIADATDPDRETFVAGNDGLILDTEPPEPPTRSAVGRTGNAREDFIRPRW